MKLFVDLGNTHLKWAQQDGSAWTIGSTVPTRQGDLGAALTQAWLDLPAPEQVMVCNVAGDAAYRAVAAASHTLWRRPVRAFVATAECAGVRNTYEDPAALGCDRWAALIWARNHVSGSVCVVDCGTAVTIDALSSQGEFVGGAIVPGLGLLRAALATGTADIGAAPGKEGDCFARTTADAVAAGTRLGLAGAIERVVREQCDRLDAPVQILLTGGDAASLIPLFGFEAQYLPDLVLRGLATAGAEC